MVVRERKINKMPTSTIKILIKKDAVPPSFSKNSRGVNFAPTRLKESAYIPARKRMNPITVIIFLFIKFYFYVTKVSKYSTLQV